MTTNIPLKMGNICKTLLILVFPINGRWANNWQMIGCEKFSGKIVVLEQKTAFL